MSAAETARARSVISALSGSGGAAVPGPSWENGRRSVGTYRAPDRVVRPCEREFVSARIVAAASAAAATGYMSAT